jgi:inward rectifier potassium channel
MMQNAPVSRQIVGGYAITTKGVSGFDLRDAYHLVVKLSWPRFILLAVCVHLVVNAFFALLYFARPSAVANARAGSFADAFFFSVETSATVGYGEMYPATLYGHIVCTAEIFTGIALTALTTGLLFVRFSRPRSRITYAATAVIARRDGRPALMIRIANARGSILYDAVSHLNLLLSIRDARGNIVRRIHELRLTRSRLPMFPLAWTLTHRIDETSPLRDYDASRLREHDVRLWLVVEARDVTLAAQVVDTKWYAPAQIALGMRYADVLSFDADGNAVADLSAISRIERDVGPEPPVSGWEDRNWDAAEA